MPALLTAPVAAPRTLLVFPERTSPAPREAHRTILVVEDDASVRKLLRQVLERSGHRVLLAENGEAAAALLRRADSPLPDLVLTDLLMPRMGGQELGLWIERSFPSLQVLYMSGFASDAWCRSDTDAVPGGILRKPFELRELLERVASVLSQAA